MKRSFNNHIIFLMLLTGLFIQCKKDDKPALVVPDEPKPTAGFTYSLPDSAKFLEYAFNSSATNYKQLLWQFGDDSTSTETTPQHRYKFPGSYHVILRTTNNQGYWASKEVVLNVVDPNFDPTKIGENYIKTIGGTLSVSRDNGGGPNAGEGSLKVIDENADTKFFQSGFSGDLWIKFELNTPVVAGAYTVTSGNDSWDRDPKSWSLQGSTDDIKWITLHTISTSQWNTNERKKLIKYYFDNNEEYKFYRLSIKSNNGSRDFQLSDWTVNKKQP